MPAKIKSIYYIGTGRRCVSSGCVVLARSNADGINSKFGPKP